MSTTSTRPAARSAGGSSRHGLAAPNVTVTSATTCAAGVSPVSGSTPLGRSTATTTGRPGVPAGGSAATMLAAGSRSPGEAPRPTMPSTTRSAASSTARGSLGLGQVAPCGLQRGQPLRVQAGAQPDGVHAGAAPRASRAPAHNASPPLLPGPTRSTTRAPVDPPPPRPELLRAHDRQAGGRTLHERSGSGARQCQLLGGPHVGHGPRPDAIAARSAAARSAAARHATLRRRTAGPRNLLSLPRLDGGCGPRREGPASVPALL